MVMSYDAGEADALSNADLNTLRLLQKLCSTQYKQKSANGSFLDRVLEVCLHRLCHYDVGVNTHLVRIPASGCKDCSVAEAREL